MTCRFSKGFRRISSFIVPAILSCCRWPAWFARGLAGCSGSLPFKKVQSRGVLSPRPIVAPLPNQWVDWASWWIQVPDLAIGWLPGGLIATLNALNRHRDSVLYSSAPHWTAHLIGLLAKRLAGRPWIADFRDPWRANPFRKLPYPSVNRFDAWLETQVVRNADRVICNTEFVREDFETRFPEYVGRFVTIPNGFDPEDYDGIVAHQPVGQSQLVITHAGYFYGPRRPQPILQAIRLLRNQGRLGRQPCVQLIGTPTYEGRCLKSIAAEFGVEDDVIIQGEVPHRQTLEALRGSDIQLLVGFGGKGSELQVPAKLFEYLGVGRPILALAPKRAQSPKFSNRQTYRAKSAIPTTLRKSPRRS